MTQPVSLTLTVNPWGGAYDRVENYRGQVHAILQEVVNQISTGVAPTYVAPVAAATQSPAFTDADFPPLPGQPNPPVRVNVQWGLEWVSLPESIFEQTQ